MNFKQVMEERRAINFFDPDRDVPDNLLKEMVELAAKAPSGFNLQPWSLIVLRDLNAREKLQKLDSAFDGRRIFQSPMPNCRHPNGVKTTTRSL